MNPKISHVLPAAALILLLIGCGREQNTTRPLEVPRGYVSQLRLIQDGQVLQFGPFVGYYFKPNEVKDLTRLSFVCFNEERFYSSDKPVNALLFEGDALLTRLPQAEFPLPAGKARIQPVFFHDAPQSWLDSRPEPQNEFLHFHSCYNKAGAVRYGYWLRHRANTSFTYDMGNRVTPASPLYHRVTPGVDKKFARIIEFDSGPEQKN